MFTDDQGKRSSKGGSYLAGKWGQENLLPVIFLPLSSCQLLYNSPRRLRGCCGSREDQFVVMFTDDQGKRSNKDDSYLAGKWGQENLLSVICLPPSSCQLLYNSPRRLRECCGSREDQFVVMFTDDQGKWSNKDDSYLAGKWGRKISCLSFSCPHLPANSFLCGDDPFSHRNTDVSGFVCSLA